MAENNAPAAETVAYGEEESALIVVLRAIDTVCGSHCDGSGITEAFEAVKGRGRAASNEMVSG